MGTSYSKKSVASPKLESAATEESIIPNMLLDPRSPDVNRTPLTGIMPHRLHNECSREQIQTTPTKKGQNRIQEHISKEIKLLDPRSPSQFIPRTPLNMSLIGDNIENHSNQYSLEYSGCIEEASCRNFNERLANITFDDMYVGAVKQQEGMADNCEENKNSLIEEETAIKTQCIQNTPIVLQSEVPKNRLGIMNVGDENISPVLHPTLCTNKRNAHSASSSTPVQPKSLLPKKHTKKAMNDEIFMDEKVTDTIYVTPAKRIKDTERPRTAFGSLLNHRVKSVENLSLQQMQLQLPQTMKNENSTPKTKPEATFKTNKCMIRY